SAAFVELSAAFIAKTTRPHWVPRSRPRGRVMCITRHAPAKVARVDMPGRCHGLRLRDIGTRSPLPRRRAWGASRHMHPRRALRPHGKGSCLGRPRPMFRRTPLSLFATIGIGAMLACGSGANEPAPPPSANGAVAPQAFAELVSIDQISVYQAVKV